MGKAYVIKSWDESGDHILFVLSDEERAQKFCNLPKWTKNHEIMEYEEVGIDLSDDELSEFVMDY